MSEARPDLRTFASYDRDFEDADPLLYDTRHRIESICTVNSTRAIPLSGIRAHQRTAANWSRDLP